MKELSVAQPAQLPLQVERERLVLLFHPKRIGYIIHYIFGFVIFITGLLNNVMTAADWLEYTDVSWTVGVAAIITGSAIVVLVELRRRMILYIVTTWNVRVRTGVFHKKTMRLFYDQIADMRYSIGKEKTRAETGDLEFYKSEKSSEPDLVFEDVYSPDGLRELVRRFIDCAPTPPPWDHISR